MKFLNVILIWLISQNCDVNCLSYESNGTLNNSIQIKYRSPHHHSSTSSLKESKSLGDVCNIFDGCHNETMVCAGNKCSCASGYSQDNEHCRKFKCTTDDQCQQGDTFRLCNVKTGDCDRCQNGLVLTKQHLHYSNRAYNRCTQRVGSFCTKTRQCNDISYIYWNMSRIEPLICRYDRCICPPGSYPDIDWTVCMSERCNNDDQCNLFADDPNRVCRSGKCVCKIGYWERSLNRVCMPHMNTVFYNYIIIPFLLALLVLTFLLIFIYIGKRIFFRMQSGERSESNITNETRRESENGLTSRFYRWYYFSRNNSTQNGTSCKTCDRSVFRFDGSPPSYNEAVDVTDVNAPSFSGTLNNSNTLPNNSTNS